MTFSLLPTISYILVSTFTPGPGNISSASMAILHGYRKTLNFQIGLASGVCLLMLLSGWFSVGLSRIFPSFESITRYVGAAYILYLATAIMKASYSLTEENTKPLTLANGFILSVLNPKLLVYSFTLFSAFLAPITANITLVISAAVLLAAISFCATSLWALSGAAIQTYLHNSRMKVIVNVILSFSLVLVALSLTGIL